MPLVVRDSFTPIFEPLVGRRVGYVPTSGGGGARLVEMAALQLFSRFGIEVVIDTLGGPNEVEHLVIAGGGGAIVPADRRGALAARMETTPTTLLPRSLDGPLGLPPHRCHVRERASLRHAADGVLMPDLILGLEVASPGAAEERVGVWLRSDPEALFAGHGLGDPDLVARCAGSYLALAARYQMVVTDRAEFAMAALLQGRKATLLPSSSPVNRSLYETWLADLGCRWRDAEPTESDADVHVWHSGAKQEARSASGAMRSEAAATDAVFIIGAPRSGTTALARAFGRHGAFYSGDETIFLIDLFGGRRAENVHERFVGRPSSSWLRRENVSLERFMAALGAGIDGLFASAAGGRRWVDHVPVHARMADTLSALFPRAKFVHVVRDGREVVQSMLHVSRTLGASESERMRQTKFVPQWQDGFREACESWRANVRSASDFERRHPERCCTVRHDRIEADPSAALADVFRFLDAPYEEAPAEFLRSGHRINSSFAPPGGCPQSEYRRPDPRSTWTDEQKALFEELCGADMRALGFAS